MYSATENILHNISLILRDYFRTQKKQHQVGFRDDRPVTNEIFVLKEIQTSCHEYNFFYTFVNYVQVRDTVGKRQQYRTLK